MILTNLFTKPELAEIQLLLRQTPYFKMRMNSFNDHCFHLARIPDWICQRITINGYKSRLCFARLNTSTKDTSFRIHSDAKTLDNLGRVFYPELACVFYPFTTPGHGTGLFKHRQFGEECRLKEGRVFTQDDGFWDMYEYYEGVENTSFVYPANKYHSRVPHKSFGKDKSDGRIVIVNFMTKIK